MFHCIVFFTWYEELLDRTSNNILVCNNKDSLEYISKMKKNEYSKVWDTRKKCPTCKGEFVTPNKNKKFCSHSCKINCQRKKDNRKEVRKYYQSREDLCNICGNKKESLKFKSCYECRLYSREYHNKRRKNERRNL